MIIRSPALAKVLNEIGSEDKIAQITQKTQKDIQAILLESCVPIGYLRWLSLKFEDLDFADFINRETLVINPKDLIRVVKNKSQRQNIVDTQINFEIQNMKKDTYDPWHICCGHDLVRALAIGLCKAIGTCNPKDVKPDILERELRLAFEHSHFYTTLLCASIRQWKKANEPFVILE